MQKVAQHLADSYRKGSHSAERVAYEVRQAILRRELLPSEHVRQEVWARRAGVSSGPTREGLKMLVAEGLLSYDAHRGYFVTRVDDHEVAQLYQIRRVLEAEVLRSIEWPTKEQIGKLIALKEVMVSLLQRGEVHQALDKVREFVFTLFDLSPLEFLVKETKRYWDRAAMYRALSFRVDEWQPRTTARYYEAVIDCLKRHDSDRLVALNSEQRASVPARISQGPGDPRQLRD